MRQNSWVLLFAVGILRLVLINLGTRGGGAEFLGAKFLQDDPSPGIHPRSIHGGGLLDGLLPEGAMSKVMLGFGAGLRHLYGARESLDRVAGFQEDVPGHYLEVIADGARWPGYPEPYFF